MEKMSVCGGSGGSRAPALEWKFSQAFGERAPGEGVQEVDIISAIEFDRKGNYLATGDCGGRVVLFERKDKEKKSPRKDLEASDYHPPLPPTYVYKTEFQSHDPEFDYLKSLEIKEAIIKIRWCPSPNNSLSILSANNRTIKLWKILEKKVKKVVEMVPKTVAISESALLGENSFTMDLNRPSTSDKIPLLTSSSAQQNLQGISTTGDANAARCQRIYAHAHAYNIHSISNNSDGETFISADDLRINLWNLEINNQCFSIIDMKPPQMEDLK